MKGISYVFKLLCPEELMHNIMGHLGESRDILEEQTGSRIRRSEDHFPGTQFRGLHILAESPDIIASVLDKVLDRLVECGDQERSRRTSSRDEASYIGKEQREYLLRVVVAERMIGCLIGPKGTIIKQIREETGAKVFIDKSPIAGHQLLKVVGLPENMRLALHRINTTVQQEAASDWYPAYARIISYGDGPGEGHSRNGSGAHADRERSPRRSGSGHSVNSDHARDDSSAQVLSDELLQLVATTAGELPRELLDQECSIMCDLPREMVSGLIGKQGANVQHIRRETGTKCRFEEAASGDAPQQTLHMQGPILSVYRAHVQMMRRYHEVQETQTRAQEAMSRPQEPKARPPDSKETPSQKTSAAAEDQVKALQEQLASLQQQLAMTQQQQQQKAAGPPAMRPPASEVWRHPSSLPILPKGKGKGKDKDKSSGKPGASA
mmetsp:Transcript_60249/g.143596  ORF Transcript_60249/g.143596 Transcript_60249/m.143596 type:complete len:438 (+) Transcript_60249:151-1464(+)